MIGRAERTSLGIIELGGGFLALGCFALALLTLMPEGVPELGLPHIEGISPHGDSADTIILLAFSAFFGGCATFARSQINQGKARRRVGL